MNPWGTAKRPGGRRVKVNPLLHFLKHGGSEGQLTFRKYSNYSSFAKQGLPRKTNRFKVNLNEHLNIGDGEIKVDFIDYCDSAIISTCFISQDSEAFDRRGNFCVVKLPDVKGPFIVRINGVIQLGVHVGPRNLNIPYLRNVRIEGSAVTGEVLLFNENCDCELDISVNGVALEKVKIVHTRELCSVDDLRECRIQNFRYNIPKFAVKSWFESPCYKFRGSGALFGRTNELWSRRAGGGQL